MRLPGEDDPSFIPMAVRRALDRSGLRLSLVAWRGLSGATQDALIALGAAPAIDVARVSRLLEHAHPTPVSQPPLDDVDPRDAPAKIVRVLGPIDAWPELHPVARHALFSYAQRDKDEKLRALWAALSGEG